MTGRVDLDKERLGSTPGPDPMDAILDPMTRGAHLQLDRWVLEFPFAKNPVPMNGSRGQHRAHAHAVRGVRLIARRQATISGIPHLDHCQVELTWYVLTNHRRDAVNLSNTLKAMQDGLVDAGVVKDDTPDLMNVPSFPKIVRVDAMRHREAWMELVISRWDGVFE